MTPLDTALRLCTRLPVFPCAETKKPTTPHGFKDATRDPIVLVDLWRKHPGPLIGVPTGAVSGLDVLDVDPKNGGDAWLREAENALPITRTHRTRSGGWHILFRHADGVKNTASKIAPGVDTRGEGGYIIWWPGHGYTIENRATVDAWPQWLMSILKPPPVRRPPPLAATALEGNSRASLMMVRAFDRVRAAAPGQRHYQLRAAAATIGGLLQFLGYSKSELEHRLVDLVMSTGAEDRANAEKTVHWAMDKGSASPLLTGR